MNAPGNIPRDPVSQSTWETLDPWEKAAQWRRVAPEISEKILELAAQRAKDQMDRERVRDAFERTLTQEAQSHSHKMDKRLWATQLIGVIGGTASVIILGIVSWYYADAGNLIPGLGIFGLGSTLTAVVYGSGYAMSRKIKSTVVEATNE